MRTVPATRHDPNVDPDVSIPARLVELLGRHVSSGSVAQGSIGWPRSRWEQQLGEQAVLLDGLPEKLDRAVVRELSESPETEEEALRSFLVAVVWGYGDVGHGPWRIRKCLESRSDLPSVLLEAAHLAADDASRTPVRRLGWRSRCRGICGPCRPPW
jgi:hypothetical protein